MSFVLHRVRQCLGHTAAIDIVDEGQGDINARADTG